VSAVDDLNFTIENVVNHTYTAVGKVRFFGPQESQHLITLGEHTLAPGETASFSVPAVELPIRSETSSMRAQPEIILKRVNSLGQPTEEKRLVPPIYYQHVAGTDFAKVEIFDEATLISHKGGRLSWGDGETVAVGDLLGYTKDGDLMIPIHAGQGEGGLVRNEQGEVIGYRLGAKLGTSQ
jgi:hypothetical protein